MKLKFSDSLIFVLPVFWFALPVAPDSRLVFFDFVALFVCLTQAKALSKSLLVRYLIISLLVYQVAMVVSAIINGLPAINIVRRCYSPFLLVVEGLALYKIMSDLKERAFVVFVLGSMLGMSIHYFYPTDERVQELPIKFLLGVPMGVILTVLVIFFVRPLFLRKCGNSIVLILYSGFCVLIGSRSVAGGFLVCALLGWMSFDVALEWRYRRVFPLMLFAALFCVYALSELYTYFAILGVFGGVAQGIAEFQSGFYGNILLGGRPEFIVNLAAFLDSPLIGHGPISQKYEYLNLLSSIGVYSDDLVYSDPEVLYHSMLFGAAHEGGIPAALFWLFVSYVTAFAIPVFVATSRAVAFLAPPFLVASLWHIFFSPLIAYNRWLVAFSIGLALIAHDVRKRFVGCGRGVVGGGGREMGIAFNG